MEITSPTQAVAVRDWAIAALNTDDTGAAISPIPFAQADVKWSARDLPRRARYLLIDGISITGYGPLVRHVTSDTQVLETVHEFREWAVSFTVTSRLDPRAPALEDSASVHLGRLTLATRGSSTLALRNVGVGYLRTGTENDVSRLRGGSEWETRSSVVITWICGRASTALVDRVDRITGTGETPPLTPLPYDSDAGA